MRTIFFDKTGTLTERTFVLQDVICGEGMGRYEALKIAVPLEVFSLHPIGRAILEEAGEVGVLPEGVSGFRSHPGLGVEGEVGGRRYYLGGRRWLEGMGVKLDDGDGEGIKAYLTDGKVLLATFVFRQSLRDSAGIVFARLKAMGVRTVVLTGDEIQGLREISDSLNPDDIFWGLLPEEKVEVIQREAGITAMVGDGVNDAPALKAASIGIAMGCGADLARESADINLSRDDLCFLIAIAGFLGSYHCFGMCSPVAALLGRRPTDPLLYNLGRLFTYGFLGFLAGATGLSIFKFFSEVEVILRIFAVVLGMVMVILGFLLILGRRGRAGWFLAPLYDTLCDGIYALSKGKGYASSFRSRDPERLPSMSSPVRLSGEGCIHL